MAEPYQVGQMILALNDNLKEQEERIAKFAASEKLASALAEYDKNIELAMAELGSANVPVTIRKDKAKGMCKDQLFIVKSLEIKWRAMLSILESTKARQNALQSYNKHLSET